MVRPMDRRTRPTVALCVTGSIAAFKAVEIARHFIQKGVRVLPVLTRSGARFVGHATFTGLCGEVARDDMWDASFPGELHIHLATEADVVVVAPATADAIARFASGRADDLMAALVLCARGPVVIAPAMHPRMYAHPATQRNVGVLRSDGRVTLVGPVVGEVANGEVGLGRMAEPSDIAAAALSLLRPQDLAGLRIVVTAGPTVEDLDPVRYLSNRSSGRMGFAIAQQAAARGAKVVLVAGPVELATPSGVERVNVRSAMEMRNALWQAMGPELKAADALVMAAAVADYRAAEPSDVKLKRVAGPQSIHFIANPDLLAELGAARSGRSPMLVGFALETATGDELARLAQAKLQSKKVDLVVANGASDAIGGDDTQAMLVSASGIETLAPMTKVALADRLLDRVAAYGKAGS
ncbi:MAG: bifunctional phosphopantothenoylcysteine decarboxylase/phosphopantothenate--cysteine ligase CoaBC [Deltaproteobacteria bacterium]|nr:bifunctional phosphopantothenoylcysteine decarboxylase/phosphopantothenate--cysteine ligase CoaBC [Deltaproteobacteria bacterium]